MITTDRLDLVPATPELLLAALAGPAALAVALGAIVPGTWPPEYLDDDAFRYVLERVASVIDEAGWWMHFVLLRPPEPRVLIGSAGYKGPPDSPGTVEIGYGIVLDRRRRGYASEAATGLVRHAFAHPGINRVIAETLPELIPSIGVLRRAGFHLLGAGSEPGVIRFELTRAEFSAIDGNPPPSAQ